MSGNINVGNLVAGLSMDSSGFTQGLESATKATDGFKSAIAKISTALKTLLTNPVVLIGALIASLIALGKACWDAFEEMDKAYDKIEIATGATGEALDDLKASFDNVFKDATYVTSAEELAGVIGDLNTYLGVTGETLEQLATQFSNLAGMEQEASVADFSQVVNKWGIDAENASEYLDYFFTLSQNTGISMDALSQGLTSNQAVLQSFGFSLQESANLLATMNKAGYDSSTITASLRYMMTQGITTKEAFEELIASVENATTQEEALANATAFGSRNIAEMTSLIQSGAFNNLTQDITETSGAIEKFARDTEDFPDIMDRMGRGATQVFAGIGSFMNDALVNVVHFFESVGQKLQPLTSSFQKVFEKIGSIFNKFWNDGEDSAGSAIDGILGFIGNLAEMVAGAVDWFAENVIPVIEPVIGYIVNLVKMFAEFFGGNFDKAFEYAIKASQQGMTFIYGILETGFNLVAGAVETFLQWVVDVIFGALNTALDVVEGFINTVIDGVNFLIAQWNSVASTLGLPTLSYLEHVVLELETPQIDLPEWGDLGVAQAMKTYIEADPEDLVTAITQNITINGDVTNPSETAKEMKKQAEATAIGVLT